MPDYFFVCIMDWDTQITLCCQRHQILIQREKGLNPSRVVAGSVIIDNRVTGSSSQSIFEWSAEVISLPKGQHPHLRFVLCMFGDEGVGSSYGCRYLTNEDAEK